MKDFKHLDNHEKAYYFYLKNHIENVKKIWAEVRDNFMPGTGEPYDNINAIDFLIGHHDESKYSNEEFGPYADYFYGKVTPEVEDTFEAAWKTHYYLNPHHWEHWVDGTQPMGFIYVVEMLCDWAAMSLHFKNGNPRQYYEANKHKMKLSDMTKRLIDKNIDKFNSYGI